MAREGAVVTKAQAKKILVQAFKALPKADRDRLLWHVEEGTHICCGKREAYLYTDGKGGG